MSHKVLICDDAAFMRTVIARLLGGSEFEVVGEAENGFEAVQRYSEHGPDIVTMDLHMPEMDGVEAIQAIVGDHPDARIVACSAEGQEDLVDEALAAGAKGFLIKPFDEAQLLDALRKALDG